MGNLFSLTARNSKLATADLSCRPLRGGSRRGAMRSDAFPFLTVSIIPKATAFRLEFTHFLASAGPPLAKAAEFNSDQQGSRAGPCGCFAVRALRSPDPTPSARAHSRSAELHLLRTLHSCLAELRMSALSWRRPPPDLLWRAGIG